jgi:hypothetical protein
MIGIFKAPSSVEITGVNSTRFNELQTAFRTSQMNFKPTWGISTLRYTAVNTGIGASSSEVDGEFRLQSGTTINNVCSLRTNQRGQYQAGTMGQVGVGLRLPTNPIGTQYARWGYTDFVNSGFYFGVDVSGKYVAYRSSGVETKIYQANWVDKLDGTGASGLTADYSDGLVSQIDFTWYGYGDVDFCLYPFNPATGNIQRVVIYHLKVEGSVSIIDPNQPLMFEVGNGASSTGNLSLYIGGHQFSVIDGNSFTQKRTVTQLITNYTTVANTNWQPIIAFRKQQTFNGRGNSVSIRLNGYEVNADDQMETRVTIQGTTSNLAWATPTGWTSQETAVEVKVSTGTALTASVDGYPIAYGFASASGKSLNKSDVVSDLPISGSVEVILWIRRIVASGTMKVLHAHLDWDEQW